MDNGDVEMKVNGWVPFRSKPFAYHLQKLQNGYHFLEDERGKRIALSPLQRRTVGVLNRLANLPTFIHRWILGRAAIMAAPRARRMHNGFLELRSIPGHEEVARLCAEHLALYRDYLARGPVALEGKGVDPGVYAAEAAKTANDPLKHVPCRYSAETTTALANFAMKPELLAAATRHIGVLPILAGVRILYSPNEPGQLTNAQLFHLDPEGARQAKGFMAVGPVGPENSPFTFLPSDTSRMMLRSGDADFTRKRVTDKAVERVVPRSEWRSHTGDAGDALLVDTSQCFHFGSRPATKPRLLFYFSYLDPFGSFMPIRSPLKRMSKTWTNYKGGASAFAAHVLGLTA